MLFAVTGLLLPSRLQSPSSCPVETIAAPGRGNGAERNRTAVRNTGVDHLVRSRPNLVILTAVVKWSRGSWGVKSDTRRRPFVASPCFPRVSRTLAARSCRHSGPKRSHHCGAPHHFKPTWLVSTGFTCNAGCPSDCCGRWHASDATVAIPFTTAFNRRSTGNAGFIHR